MAQKSPAEVQSGIAERVRALTEEVLQDTPYYLVEVDVRGHYGTRVVEVYIDGEQDVGLDEVAAVSKEIDFLMEMEDAVEGSHKLEVSTPGAARPLTDPRQYRKNVGHGLRVKFARNGGARERVEGELTDATDDDIEVTQASGRAERIAYDDIQEAKLKLPW